MRGKRKGAVFVLAILLGIGVVVLGSGQASGQGDVHVVIQAGGHGRDVFIDVVGGPRLSLGDGIAARGPLVDPQSGERVGTSYFECTVMRKIVGIDQGLWWCSYLLELADGDILLQGLDPRGVGASTFAVIGGTEAYRGASGDAVLTDTFESTDIVITLI